MQIDTRPGSADRNQTVSRMSRAFRRVFRLSHDFISRVGGQRNAPSSLALRIITTTLMIGVFIFDTVTPYEIAAANLYVVVVLLSVRFSRKRGVVVISAMCMVPSRSW